MTKSLLILSTIFLIAQGANIDFNQAPRIQERALPLDNNKVLSYANVLQETTPSIVHISSSKKVQQNKQMQEFLEEFFGRRMPPQHSPQKRSLGLGSGVIISSDGYIVTNNHVIDEADTITVTLPGKNAEYEAKLIGSDPKSDLAVIKVEADEPLAAIRMGDSNDLQVGDVVFAIGNPFGVGQSVTQGIISAQHKNGIGLNEYENFIQTDASINPGNSGGALVDSRGVLIGINSAILSRSGGNNGIGFAIEVNLVKHVVQKLIEDGKVTRGYMGVQISDINAKLKALYKNKSGAVLIDVNENTPAEKAGLKRGDLITKVDGHVIKNANDLKNRVGLLSPDKRIEVEYERNKKNYTTHLVLQTQESLQASVNESLLGGLSLKTLDNNLRYQYRIPSHIKGLLVTGVDTEGEAQQQGIQKGDIIIQVEGYTVTSVDALKDVLKRYEGAYKRVYINRDGNIFMVALK